MALALSGAKASFDEGLAKIYLMSVLRFLLAMFVAIGLAFSPAAPAIAMASPAAMPGCSMDNEMPEHPADHSKMDCCTAVCQAPAAAALLPRQGAVGESLPVDQQALVELSSKALVSLSRTALDPPPRALLS